MGVSGAIGMPRGGGWNELGESGVHLVNNFIHSGSVLVEIKISKPQEIVLIEQGTSVGVVIRPGYGSNDFLLQDL